ncbi:hypothetical protein JCM19000A_11430 [Silvimonas sp. JCM 19000]
MRAARCLPALALLLALNGCVVVPVDGIISATADGIATITAAAANANQNSNSFQYVRPYLSLKEVCIEWNEKVTVPDFVPSLQVGLKHYGIESRVYSPGTEPPGCATLYYSASRKWEKKWGQDEDVSYLGEAALSLRRNGQLLGSASYEASNYGFDKWKNTGAKLGPVIDSMLAGN